VSARVSPKDQIRYEIDAVFTGDRGLGRRARGRRLPRFPVDHPDCVGDGGADCRGHARYQRAGNTTRLAPETATATQDR
jgi:hypothetical protein